MKVKNKGWRLDYFIVSPDVVHAVSGIKLDSQQAYSDHAPLLLTMK